MKKVLAWKFGLIALIIVLAFFRVYPPNEKLKAGLDLAGGTSLIYEIDVADMSRQDTKGLAEKTITVLKRRVDPYGVRNLIWRPLSNTRFEIQMPLASKDAQSKRGNYESALAQLLSKNINVSKVLRSLYKPTADRDKDFNDFAAGSQYAQNVLNELTTAYDELQTARLAADELAAKLKEPEADIALAKLDLDEVQANVGYWMIVDSNERTKLLEAFLGVDKTDVKLALLEDYTGLYKRWSKAIEVLTTPETGQNIIYENAKAKLKGLVLTEDELKQVLDQKEKKRQMAVAGLLERYPDRKEEIRQLVKAFEGYKKYRGRLDDPKDLQRMLKGAGILEFRILPTSGDIKSDSELHKAYVENLVEKGPKFASDSKYVWMPVENREEWLSPGMEITVRDENKNPCVIGEFGGKFYVLCSNKPEEMMLHKNEEDSWRLKRSRRTLDQQGRRAIGFTLDDRGGWLFSKLTGDNLGRPLCILLDGMALSAPSIGDQIGKEGVIRGDFSEEEIQDMVDKLNAGSLPAMLVEQPISVKSIGPSLGAANRDKGINAGIIGLIVVVGIMMVYYLAAGGIADLALLFNMLIILAVMAFRQATFTLPGIAGLILTIGMSVDANVLIFERIREEQLKGSSLRISIKNGYQKALRTILDANITTFITAMILYGVAPEEVKGFALVLMIGIVTSMFTALFATRVIFDLLIEFGILKDRIIMLRLIKKPNVNWMKLRPVFLTLSAILIGGGMLIFFTRDDTKNSKYDIEFTGGTAVTIDLKEPTHVQEVRDKIKAVGQETGNPAIAASNVYKVGEIQQEEGTQFEINTTETNKTVTKITFAEAGITKEQIVSGIKNTQKLLNRKLTNLIITADADQANTFVIKTSLLHKSAVKEVLEKAFLNATIGEPKFDEVVNNAVIKAFGEDLQLRRSLEPKVTFTDKVTKEMAEKMPELLDYIGGVKITCNLGREITPERLERRFKDLRLKPEMENATWYDYMLVNEQLRPLVKAKVENEEQKESEPVSSFVYVSVEPEAGSRELSDREWKTFIADETSKVMMAGELEESLPRVTQVNPSIGSEAKTAAMLAIGLSLGAIILYVWIRFGNVRYGLASIAALVHDVCITLGAVVACTYIVKSGIGQALLLQDFKISQVIIAAFLTLIGYSLNDTIVVFDRIRENRKKAQLQPNTINDSINQTISRTIMTSLTTFVVVLVMYIFGGQSLRGFTFAIGLGIIIGTYSSIAIAAPLLLLGIGKESKNK